MECTEVKLNYSSTYETWMNVSNVQKQVTEEYICYVSMPVKGKNGLLKT